jgi:hypothetical protein
MPSFNIVVLCEICDNELNTECSPATTRHDSEIVVYALPCEVCLADLREESS